MFLFLASVEVIRGASGGFVCPCCCSAFSVGRPACAAVWFHLVLISVLRGVCGGFFRLRSTSAFAVGLLRARWFRIVFFSRRLCWSAHVDNCGVFRKLAAVKYPPSYNSSEIRPAGRAAIWRAQTDTPVDIRATPKWGVPHNGKNANLTPEPSAKCLLGASLPRVAEY